MIFIKQGTDRAVERCRGTWTCVHPASLTFLPKATRGSRPRTLGAPSILRSLDKAALILAFHTVGTKVDLDDDATVLQIKISLLVFLFFEDVHLRRHFWQTLQTLQSFRSFHTLLLNFLNFQTIRDFTRGCAHSAVRKAHHETHSRHGRHARAWRRGPSLWGVRSIMSSTSGVR